MNWSGHYYEIPLKLLGIIRTLAENWSGPAPARAALPALQEIFQVEIGHNIDKINHIIFRQK